MERTIVYKEKVFEELKRAIISRTYQPGEILNERKLASEMDVSRTPVREAIQLLANEGWVKVIPWKGAVVQSVTLQDIEESMQLRMAIEPVVIDLVMPDHEATSRYPFANRSGGDATVSPIS